MSIADLIDVSQKRPENLETVIIFDWDDTIMPSSFLSSKGYSSYNKFQRVPFIDAQLKQLEEIVIECIQHALIYGKVCIITNAQEEWVEISACKFMPKLLPLLKQITVISARSTFEKR